MTIARMRDPRLPTSPVPDWVNWFADILRDPAAQCVRAVDEMFRPLGGRGECRMPAAPAVSCACCSGRRHTSNNEYTGITRHPRTQSIYGLFRSLLGHRPVLPPALPASRCL